MVVASFPAGRARRNRLPHRVLGIVVIAALFVDAFSIRLIALGQLVARLDTSERGTALVRPGIARPRNSLNSRDV